MGISDARNFSTPDEITRSWLAEGNFKNKWTENLCKLLCFIIDWLGRPSRLRIHQHSWAFRHGCPRSTHRPDDAWKTNIHLAYNFVVHQCLTILSPAAWTCPLGRQCGKDKIISKLWCMSWRQWSALSKSGDPLPASDMQISLCWLFIVHSFIHEVEFRRMSLSAWQCIWRHVTSLEYRMSG